MEGLSLRRAGLHSSEPSGKVCLGLAGILWNAQTGVKKIESPFGVKTNGSKMGLFAQDNPQLFLVSSILFWLLST